MTSILQPFEAKRNPNETGTTSIYASPNNNNVQVVVANEQQIQKLQVALSTLQDSIDTLQGDQERQDGLITNQTSAINENTKDIQSLEEQVNSLKTLDHLTAPNDATLTLSTYSESAGYGDLRLRSPNQSATTYGFRLYQNATQGSVLSTTSLFARNLYLNNTITHLPVSTSKPSYLNYVDAIAGASNVNTVDSDDDHLMPTVGYVNKVISMIPKNIYFESIPWPSENISTTAQYHILSPPNLSPGSTIIVFYSVAGTVGSVGQHFLLLSISSSSTTDLTTETCWPTSANISAMTPTTNSVFSGSFAYTITTAQSEYYLKFAMTSSVFAIKNGQNSLFILYVVQ